jgi:L-iditol 2-dehydrogenase
VVSVKALHHLPNQVTYVEGAILDSAGVALHGLRQAVVEPGSTAVVIGPGAIGLCAIQLVKALGAARVIAVGRRGARLTLAGEIGADEIVDVLEGQPIEQVLSLTDGLGADITVESAGTPAAPAYAPKMTRFGGKIVLLGFFVPSEVEIPLGDVVYKEQTIFGIRADPNIYSQVLQLMAAGKLDVKPLISHTFPLKEFDIAFDTFVNRKDGALKVVIEP